MNQKLRYHAPFLILLFFLTAFQLWGAAGVPFHPDESTYLFMSADFEAWLSAPLALAYDPAEPLDARARYRAIDAPLLRYLVGAGRRLAGMAALPVDWDWTASWQANQEAGGVPPDSLLQAGRLAVTLLLPLTTTLIYLSADRIGGRPGALVAAVFFGSHSLALLHGRRVMTEGLLLLGLALLIWCLAHARSRPWLLGLSAALAVNAKHSALAILPVAGLALLWSPEGALKKGRPLIRALMIAGAAFILLTGLVNPYLWKDPLAALQLSADLRTELLDRQLETLATLAPGQVLDSPGLRGLVAAANLYVLPPSFAETVNYQDQLTGQVSSYLAIPGHGLFRGLVPGGILLFLTLLGLLLGLVEVRRASLLEKRVLTLLLLATACQLAAHIFLVPLAWQRYVVPLLPFLSLWIGFAVSKIFRVVPQLSRKKLPGHADERPDLAASSAVQEQ